jgi:hypothetical protein
VLDEFDGSFDDRQTRKPDVIELDSSDVESLDMSNCEAQTNYKIIQNQYSRLTVTPEIKHGASGTISKKRDYYVLHVLHPLCGFVMESWRFRTIKDIAGFLGMAYGTVRKWYDDSVRLNCQLYDDVVVDDVPEADGEKKKEPSIKDYDTESGYDLTDVIGLGGGNCFVIERVGVSDE